MPQFEPGLYEPGENVFDGSEDEDEVENSRLPLLIVLALLVLAMFAGFVWLAYNEGVARGRSENPLVASDTNAAKPAAGSQQAYKGFKIYEQPAPPDDDTAAAATPTETEPAPVKSAPAETKAAPAPSPAATAKTEPPKALAEAQSKAPPGPAKPASQEKPQAKPVAKPPVAPQTALPSTATTPAPTAAPLATAPPRALTANAPKPAQTATAPSAATVGAYVLQIGAYKSQGEADAAWAAYKAKHAALVQGYAPNVVQADLGEKGIWYRLRIAGFSGKDAANALCDRLKAEGGACFLGR